MEIIMTIRWALTFALTLAQFTFICRMKCSRWILIGQGFTAAAALTLVVLYYAPCSKSCYEWSALASEILGSSLDLAIGLEIIVLTRWLRNAGPLELATVALIGLHQHIKIQWSWASLMFQIPAGADAYLNDVRFASNLACLVALGLLAHYQHRSIHDPA